MSKRLIDVTGMRDVVQRRIPVMSLEMTEPGVGAPRQPSSDTQVLRYTSGPRCTSSGILRFSVMPGDTVSDNQELARVYSAFGSVEETIRAARSGYILGVSDRARALPGAEIIAIAEFDESPGEPGDVDAAGAVDAASDNEVNVGA